ncbi:MAG: alpha/beta fold hydrolase [Hyphomicrobiaceae bacterium]|nr:alpha/beta fold hydrolase [Hyphomicrobiaceae bacterium]
MTAATTGLDWQRDGQDWPNRGASRFVESAGLTWHIQETGQGPRLLLVHGTAASTHSWRGLLPLLARRYNVLAPDLPGHGFTTAPPKSRLSLPGMAHDLGALLQDVRFVPDICVGHSAGAAILVRQALDGVIAPKAIVSLNGALLPFDGMGGVLFPALAKLLFVNPVMPRLVAWRANDIKAVERLILGTGSTIDRAGLEDYRRLFSSERHAGTALAMMANWSLDVLKRELSRLSVPLELVAAAEDRAIPPAVAFEVKTMVADAHVSFVRGLGHLAHEEDPERIARLIEDRTDARLGSVGSAE